MFPCWLEFPNITPFKKVQLSGSDFQSKTSQNKCLLIYFLTRLLVYLLNQLRIEQSVFACFFKTIIFPVSFSNAKWIQISLESLTIELYFHLKIYLYYFPGRLKYAELGKSTRLTFWVPVPKVVEVGLYHNICILLFCIDLSTKPYRGLWITRTHLPLFQIMSVKIYTNFFLFSGGFNFKTNNYLKGKMRKGIWVHILLNNLALSPLRHRYYFWRRRSKCYENPGTFYSEIFEFKVFLRDVICLVSLLHIFYCLLVNTVYAKKQMSWCVSKKYLGKWVDT